MSTLKERVKEAIDMAKNNGYSVADLAKESGVSVQAVYQWADPQSPLNELKGSSLMGLAKVSGFSPWWINGGTGEKVLVYAKNTHQQAVLQVMESMDIKYQAKMPGLGNSLAQPEEGTNGKR